MKKVLASMMALSMVATMAVPAFAATFTNSDEGTASYPNVIKKNADKGDYTAVSNNALDVKPDSTYYFIISTGADVTVTATKDSTTEAVKMADLLDGDLFKFDYDKTEGGKNIKSIKLMEKDVDGTAARDAVVEVKTREDMTGDEFIAEFEVAFKAKNDYFENAANAARFPKKDLTIKFPEMKLFISNSTKETDDDTTEPGTGGFVYKPVTNEENFVEWEDENNTIATLTFDADSSVNKYFPKLSTKWDNVKYAELFADQDAFYRSFVANPAVSSTSRAVLELTVPYVDEDGELTADLDAIVVYQEIDGEPVDITEKGKFVENDDDTYVFQIKTRELGTYIFAETAITDEVVDDEPVEEPTDSEGNKANPGTGC